MQIDSGSSSSSWLVWPMMHTIQTAQLWLLIFNRPKFQLLQLPRTNTCMNCIVTPLGPISFAVCWPSTCRTEQFSATTNSWSFRNWINANLLYKLLYMLRVYVLYWSCAYAVLNFVVLLCAIRWRRMTMITGAVLRGGTRGGVGEGHATQRVWLLTAPHEFKFLLSIIEQLRWKFSDYILVLCQNCISEHMTDTIFLVTAPLPLWEWDNPWPPRLRC